MIGSCIKDINETLLIKTVDNMCLTQLLYITLPSPRFAFKPGALKL